MLEVCMKFKNLCTENHDYLEPGPRLRKLGRYNYKGDQALKEPWIANRRVLTGFSGGNPTVTFPLFLLIKDVLDDNHQPVVCILSSNQEFSEFRDTYDRGPGISAAAVCRFGEPFFPTP